LNSDNSNKVKLNVIAFKNLFTKIVNSDNKYITFIIENEDKLSRKKFQKHLDKLLSKYLMIDGIYKENGFEIGFRVIQVYNTNNKQSKLGVQGNIY
jgi:hypothetical protein